MSTSESKTEVEFIDSGIRFEMAEPVDYFKRLPEIAERLGVKPVPDGDCYGRVTWSRGPQFGDNRRWDIFELMAAALDRLDAAIK